MAPTYYDNYYQVLGVDHKASPRAIQKAFHGLAKELHPDKNPNNHTAAEKFKRITEAYVVLSDPKKKSRYDLNLRYGAVASLRTNPRYGRYTSRRNPRVSRSFYQKNQTFSKHAKIGGAVAIVAIILVIAVTTFFMTRYNAGFDFQKGLANYHNQRYSTAYFNLEESISPLNPYLAAAHLLMAEISFSQQKNLNLTRKHLKKAYQAKPSDSINARLLYLEGKVDNLDGNYETAYQLFQKSTLLLPGLDSATYKMAEIDLFVFERFDRALAHFKTLVQHNPKNHEAFLASAYCHQKLDQHEKAITQIDAFLLLRTDVGMAHYIKAISAQALNWSEISCTNYLEANRLGVNAAKDSLISYCGLTITP